MEFKLRLPDDERRKIAKSGVALRAGVFKGMKRALLLVESEAKQSFGRPDNLKVRTGHLRRSIATRVERKGSGEVVGSIGSNVVYAAIHEFGGPHPRSTTGKQMKKRPYIRPAIDDNMIQINRIFKKAIKEEVRKRKL